MRPSRKSRGMALWRWLLAMLDWAQETTISGKTRAPTSVDCAGAHFSPRYRRRHQARAGPSRAARSRNGPPSVSRHWASSIHFTRRAGNRAVCSSIPTVRILASMIRGLGSARIQPRARLVDGALATPFGLYRPRCVRPSQASRRW
jgi:hypothetical protein